jgi:hypothetical protein
MIRYELIQLSNIAEGDGENDKDEGILLLFAFLCKLSECLNKKIVAEKSAGCRYEKNGVGIIS